MVQSSYGAVRSALERIRPQGPQESATNPDAGHMFVQGVGALVAPLLVRILSKLLEEIFCVV